MSDRDLPPITLDFDGSCGAGLIGLIAATLAGAVSGGLIGVLVTLLWLSA